MEEGSNLPCGGVDAAKIRPLVPIAAVTGPSEIIQRGFPAVLVGDDMLEVKGFERRKPVREVTVFAAPAGPLANLLA